MLLRLREEGAERGGRLGGLGGDGSGLGAQPVPHDPRRQVLLGVGVRVALVEQHDGAVVARVAHGAAEGLAERTPAELLVVPLAVEDTHAARRALLRGEGAVVLRLGLVRVRVRVRLTPTLTLTLTLSLSLTLNLLGLTLTCIRGSALCGSGTPTQSTPG